MAVFGQPLSAAHPALTPHRRQNRIAVRAGTASGSTPRVAIEGCVGNQLLGGVAIDIIVLRYVPFAPYHVHLPKIGR